MKNIYVIIDMCPSEWGEFSIVGMKWYLTKLDANKKKERLKEENPYRNQYFEVAKLQLELL